MRLFISYRRDDSAGYAGRLADQLAAHFGRERVFRDVVSIEPGEDFVHAIERAVASCDMLVAVVGKDWHDVRDRDGKRRLDAPGDYVRLEVAAALARGVRVLPVLVEGASMPTEGDLPESLRPFARRNAIELRDATWDHDVGRLIEAIGRHPGAASRALRTRRRAVALAVSTAGLLLAVGLGLKLFQSTPSAVGPAKTTPERTAVNPAEPRRSPPPVSQPAVARSSLPLTIPAGARTIFLDGWGGHLVYEVRSAHLESGAGRESLVLTVRLTNNGPTGVNFWDNSFRLIVDDVPVAPIGGLNESVWGRTVKEESVVFPGRPADRPHVLQISVYGKTATIKLGDLRPRSGDSREPAAAAPTARSRPVNAEIAMGKVAFRIATATFEPYSDRQVLSLAVRMTNNGQTDVGLWNSSFRLLVNGLPQAPVSGLNDSVAAHTAKDVTVMFELPEHASDLVLRIFFGGETKDVRLG